ncbi:MAG: hypothetical protein ACI4XE_02040 [Acutalibacteraceae bacterium]
MIYYTGNPQSCFHNHYMTVILKAASSIAFLGRGTATKEGELKF